MIIWRLRKTGDRHWPELPCNQLRVMCHFQLVPYPSLIRDHCVSLAWPDNIYAISAMVIWQLLCHKVMYLFFFTSEDPPNYDGSHKGLLHPLQREAQHPILTARSPLASLLGDWMQTSTLVWETQGSLALLAVWTVRIKMPFFFLPCPNALDMRAKTAQGMFHLNYTSIHWLLRRRFPGQFRT